MRHLTLALAALAFAHLTGCGGDSGATAASTGDDAEIPVGDTTGEVASDETGDSSMGGETTPTDSSGTDTSTPPSDTATGDTATMMTTAMTCGTMTCNSATQECCVTAGIGACVAKGGTCLGARYACTEKANCPSGQVCCLPGTTSGTATCTMTCPTTELCSTSADCSGSKKNCVAYSAGIKACSK